jgi:DNA-binding NarL/FixJ family response regulator
MDNTYAMEVRRAMSVVTLYTDSTNVELLDAVRTLDMFVSDSLDWQERDIKRMNGLANIIMRDEPKVKLRGISAKTLAKAEGLLRSGWKSRVQIANHLNITTDTVKTKVMPNIRRSHKVERERFGVTGRYKYRIA